MAGVAEKLQSGDVRWLARAITAAVEQAPEAEALLRAAYPHTGRALVVGLTGAPGAGKSTLADGLAKAYRAAGETVGIVAVDPTSPFTGGAILGDRIRMQELHSDPGVFIRSLATRGAMGGLATAASEVVALLDAAGKDRILVETVGVGQDEVDIIKLADVTVVVLVPGMGDAVQTLKAGLMEIADIFVVNKADRGPERLEQELRAMLALAPHGREDWRPPILKTVATSASGVAELQQAIATRLEWMEAHGGLRQFRARQWEERLRQFARQRLADRLLTPLLSEERLRGLARRVIEHGTDPFTAVDEVIAEALAQPAAGRNPVS
ncbi:MAG TPA: methylmalonyl Co-A mutase-associated GTPase MeaB [Terriglobales bacterium]|nr:methylmalonyl Co-A mutase-associated GTPase MeaB [Terriglobales bacterium]